MSVFINVGQCGNQVGAALMALAKDPQGKKRSEHLRCILVDTEPKVVRSIQFPANVSAVHMEQSGRGNLWAMGYNKTKSKELCARVMESLRREIEAMDCYRGSFLLHSLAGGTGSGLGCRLLEKIRGAYPKAYLVSGCVAPSLRGDTPLQNYNALFTLRHLQDFTDAVLFKDNDDLLRTVSYWRGTQSKPKTSVSLGEINASLAADWAGLLFPTIQSKLRRVFDIGSFVTRVCPLPEAKFVDVRSAYYISKARSVSFAQFSTASHQDVMPLARQLVESFPRTASLAIGQHVVARGFKDQSMTAAADAMRKGVRCADWGVPSPSLQLSSSPLASSVLSSLTMCSNGTNIAPVLRTYLDRASTQFQARAYLHWYEKFGVDKAYFEESFGKTEDILRHYDTLTQPERLPRA
ncbi:unnamed protein product [Aphanomyces euteiches]|uniref:Tubulin delta chain n=1 Tax=Aphanomyces euteiches TaxID=100861 RepID=A0A6G0XWW9_9STRA|nr:hypothetical protein Ae201684_000571 [Aphanomyces euteiches]KAH9091571.1 hypothetical protein Ae201684P_011116 [Aphanomyces euteiches]KAH9155823.1 hypothetical protein AeRB84_002246 [Aphanomyces euteiches]